MLDHERDHRLAHAPAQRIGPSFGNRQNPSCSGRKLLLKQQLLVLRRSRPRAPNFSTTDRLLLGFWSLFLSPSRLRRAVTILKPSTLLRFHRGRKECKYRWLYSSGPTRKPGPKGRAPELIRAMCEFKRRNPGYGCPKIALHLAKTFGLEINEDVVRRLLTAHYRPERRESGLPGSRGVCIRSPSSMTRNHETCLVL